MNIFTWLSDIFPQHTLLPEQLPNMAPSFVEITAFQRVHSKEIDNVISQYI